MKTLQKAAVVGGDERSAVCAELLAKSGTECAVFGLEKYNRCLSATKAVSLSDAVCGCDALVLPLPVMSDSACVFSPLSDEKILLSDIAENLSDNTLIFAGNPQKCFFSMLDALKKENEVINYTHADAFAVAGSVPTAEGAVIEAINATQKTVSSSKILVVGCGRIGKQLALLLKSMNASVTVSARKPHDLAFICSNGMNAVKTEEIANIGKSFDVIFNTVPAMVFDEKALLGIVGKPVIIELASKPYGEGFNKDAKKGMLKRIRTAKK